MGVDSLDLCIDSSWVEEITLDVSKLYIIIDNLAILASFWFNNYLFQKNSTKCLNTRLLIYRISFDQLIGHLEETKFYGKTNGPNFLGFVPKG